MIENDKVLPNALWLRNGTLLELLKPLALSLGVDLVAAKKLPSLDQAKRGLLKFLDRQR